MRADSWQTLGGAADNLNIDPTTGDLIVTGKLCQLKHSRNNLLTSMCSIPRHRRSTVVCEGRQSSRKVVESTFRSPPVKTEFEL
jgi:hypothetical protein